MSDVFVWVFIILGLLFAFPGTWLLFGALAPDGVERARTRMRTRPILTFFTGIGTILIAILAIAALSATNLGPFQTIAVLLSGATIGFAMFGVSGLAKQLGSRLPSAIDADNPWRAHLRGSIVLELAFLVPVLGWFLVLPLSLILGAGAATQAVLFRRNPAPAPQTEVMVPPVAEKVEASL